MGGIEPDSLAFFGRFFWKDARGEQKLGQRRRLPESLSGSCLHPWRFSEEHASRALCDGGSLVLPSSALLGANHVYASGDAFQLVQPRRLALWQSEPLALSVSSEGRSSDAEPSLGSLGLLLDKLTRHLSPARCEHIRFVLWPHGPAGLLRCVSNLEAAVGSHSSRTEQSHCRYGTNDSLCLGRIALNAVIREQVRISGASGPKLIS